MTSLGIRALKQNASAVVARVAAGERIIVTDRGRAVAELTPLPASPLARLIASGRARPPRHDLRDLDEPEPGPDLVVELAARRDAERY